MATCALGSFSVVSKLIMGINVFLAVVSAVLAVGWSEGPSVDCPVPVSPVNGKVELSSHGTTLKYACDPGYKIMGARFAHCEGNQWRPDPPTCLMEDKVGWFGWKRTCAYSGCQQRCVLKKNKEVECKCRAGFRLLENGKTCEIDPEFSGDPQPAHNRLCYGKEYCAPVCTLRENGGKTCECQEGYVLDSLRQLCRVVPVTGKFRSNNRHCYGQEYCTPACALQPDGRKACHCQEGYELVASGQWCRDINECETDNFGCAHRCFNSRGGAYCSCDDGYVLSSDGKSCFDLDECSHERYNKCEQHCTNTIGSYTCSCSPGYVLQKKFACKGCPENTYQTGNGCESCPRNSHTNGTAKAAVSDCRCNLGYVGDPSQDEECADVDECLENNFGCSYECINTPGSAICSCPEGYELGSDSKTCVDIDECSIKNGGCEGICHNFVGGYNCSCSKGYRLDGTHACSDIDECITKNGMCSQKCVNFPGGYFCSCNEGFKLDSSQKSCVNVTCPRLPTPSNAYVKCSKEQQEKDFFLVNTTCLYYCKSGYKATSKRSIVCNKDGKWSDSPPVCKELQCSELKVPQNGNVYPPICRRGRVNVLQACYFACDQGFKLSQKNNRWKCLRNLSWNHLTFPSCQPIKISPHIVCPDDISVTLPEGESSASVYISRPSTNVNLGKLSWFPDTIQLDSNVTFPAGSTEVSFDAGANASCSFIVNVIDSEAPKAVFCPDSFTVWMNGSFAAPVLWEEPVFTDNVKVDTVQANLMPNETLQPGTHHVKYIAYDATGNKGICLFSITVKSPTCQGPVGPRLGDPNCNDWAFGKICEPECPDGFVLFPQYPNIFTCDDSGTWSPGITIQDCTPFTRVTTQNCTDGFEYQVHADTGEDICVMCPENFAWSEATRMCSEQNFANDFDTKELYANITELDYY